MTEREREREGTPIFFKTEWQLINITGMSEYYYLATISEKWVGQILSMDAYNIGWKSWWGIGYLIVSRYFSQITSYRRKNGNFIVEKPGRHHLNRWSKFHHQYWNWHLMLHKIRIHESKLIIKKDYIHRTKMRAIS